MSLKQLFQFVDTPLAIVVGSVGAVLITLQLGAVGMLAQGQVDRASEREAGMRVQRMATARCLGVSGAQAYAACRQQALTDSVPDAALSADDTVTVAAR